MNLIDIDKSILRLKELLTVFSFLFGALRSTPEGQKRRAAIRLQKDIEDWRKDRYKFIKDLRKDHQKDEITKAQLEEKLADWDLHHPEPK